MILKIHLPFRRTFLQASIPFLLYSLISCIETTLPYDSYSLLQSSKDILLGLYSSYPLFMLAMMILNGIIDAIKGPKEAELIHKGNKIFLQMIRNCLCFTLIYACFQLITGSLPQQELSENLSLNTTINGLREVPRILEGETSEDYLMRDTSNIELFEVGKIIGSRIIERSAMTTSKDGKTIFLFGQYHGMLRIFDISDNQNPKVLSTLALSYMSGPEKSLLLSADEKILYTSSGILLEIVDVSNLKSPVFLSSFVDFDVETLHAKADFGFVYTSMAFSWNEETLYVGGCALQIFSVKDPKKPQLISSFAKPGPKKTLFATSVATSADKKTLYFANGTIEVYNISLNPNKPVLQSTFKMESRVSSLILGKDNKTLFAAGRAENNTVILEKIAIQKDLKSLESFNLGISSASPPAILEKSLLESTFFLFTTEEVKDTAWNSTSKKPVFRAYNLGNREILSHSKDLFPVTIGTLRAIPNTKNFVISKDEEFNIVSFFSNYPNSHSFGLSNNTIGVYKPRTGIILFAVPSAIGMDMLYTITFFDQKYYFNIVEMSNKNGPEVLASFLLDIQAHYLYLAENAKRAFAVDTNKTIQVLDLSDFPKIQSLGLTQLESFEEKYFYLLKDGKTALMEIPKKDIPAIQLKMLDFSDLSPIKIIAEEEVDSGYENSMSQVSSQGIIFLCLNTEVLIYNLSAPASSRRIGSIDFPSREQAPQDLVKCSLFEEKGIFFLETHNQDTMHYLSIFNISKITSPELLTMIPLPRFRSKGNLVPTIISSDALKVYCWDLEHVLMIDLSSDFKSHVIVGQIPVPWYSINLPNFHLSGDNKFGYFDYMGTIVMINLQMKYSLYMNNNNFALGKKYAADFMLLQLNKKSHFEPFAEYNYKIIKLSLSKISLGEGRYEAQTTLSSLPDWITFDKESYLLNIESKKERDLGNYTLYSACSLKVPFEAFDFIGNRTDAEDLVTTLVALGFLDNQRFLTSAFSTQRNFLIQSQYSKNKEKIYETLKQYSFETFTPFRLQPSLDLTMNSGSLSIITPSLDVIKVDLKLKYDIGENEKENPQFLLRNYGSIVPLITEHKTHLRIEGLLDEVNMALEKLVINNKTLLCDGEIIVTDNLNQPLVREVKNITKYFTTNKPPSKNLDVQNQINMVPVYTGEFVTISLNQNTFIDENVEKLNYKLVMNTPERHDKPSWLVFSNDLVMKITAPEQILNRQIELLLIAENEFEKVEVPFTLKIKLSPVYLLKLLIQLSPYLLTIIGLYIKANKIYNILAQKWYKHPKEFFVEIEREIGPEMIPPIWFIAGEKKESELIMREICKKVASDREKLVDYFWNSGGELDGEKLRQMIEEVVAEIEDNKKKLKLYLSEGKSRKSLINQMIQNQFVLWRFDMKQEKMTKEMFNKMRDSWIELVKWDNLKNQFVIKQEKFEEILASFGEVASPKESTGESIYLSQVTHDESLLKRDSEINIDLLKKALIVLAFKNYTLDIEGIGAYVKVKQKGESSCLKSFLRTDLKDVSLSDKGTIGYGIMYKIAGDRLEFRGVPDKHLEDDILVVQITNSHERILKELWIHGMGHKNDTRPEMLQSYGVL